MKRIFAYLPLLLGLLGCIKNDIPFPTIVPEVLSLDVEDASSVNVDVLRRSVTIELSEIADIKSVKINSSRFLHEMTVCEPQMTGIHDLSSPKKFVLTTYQDYQWTVSAKQTIERYFKVKGQVGSAIIDEVNRRIVVNVTEKNDISDLTVTSMKLGPSGITTQIPAMEDIRDFSNGVEVTLIFHNRVETWWLYASVTDVTVEMISIDPWTSSAILKASGLEGASCGFRWREKGTEEWVEASGVETDGGMFSVRLDGLSPETGYECLAYCNEDVTEVIDFVTDEARQLPNAGFEVTSPSSDGKYREWYNSEAADPFCRTPWWGSGNGSKDYSGSAAYAIICAPDTDNKIEGAQSACLISRYAIVKFAAGNLFSGDFGGLVGTQGGIINFGRPWTQRPRAVRLWTRYDCGTVDYVDASKIGNRIRMGDPDECSMTILLGDWDPKKYGGTISSPVQVNTTDLSTFLDTSSDAVIASGLFFSNKSSTEWDSEITGASIVSTSPGGWVELEIPLDYRTVERRPTHIILSFASSRYGDYFTGSSSSVMWLDNVRMVY